KRCNSESSIAQHPKTTQSSNAAAASLATKRKQMKLFRNVPINIQELHLALAGLPKDMKVKANQEKGGSEKNVYELRARTTWTTGLVVTRPPPRELRRKSFVKISKA